MWSILTPLLAPLTGSISALISNVIQMRFEVKKEALQIENKKLDQAHELAMLDKQALIQDKVTEQSNFKEESAKDRVIQKQITLLSQSENVVIAFLNGTIRPIITIVINAIFFFLLYETVTTLIESKVSVLDWFKLEVFTRFFLMFELVTAYWFTARSMKTRG